MASLLACARSCAAGLTRIMAQRVTRTRNQSVLESGLVCVGGCEPCAVLEWSWVKDSALGEKFRARKVCDGLGEDAWQKLTVTL